MKEKLEEIKKEIMLFTERNNRNLWADFIMSALETTKEEAWQLGYDEGVIDSNE